jgi:hypothetical protein
MKHKKAKVYGDEDPHYLDTMHRVGEKDVTSRIETPAVKGGITIQLPTY